MITDLYIGELGLQFLGCLDLMQLPKFVCALGLLLYSYCGSGVPVPQK